MDLDKNFINQHDLNVKPQTDNVNTDALKKAVFNIKDKGFTKNGQEQAASIMNLADKNKSWLYTKDYIGSAIAMPDDVLQNSLIGKTGSSKVNITDANDTSDFSDDEDDLMDRIIGDDDEYNNEEEEEGEFI